MLRRSIFKRIFVCLGTFMLVGHGVRNHEGGPSRCKRTAVIGILVFLNVFLSATAEYIYAVLVPKYHWSCYSKFFTTLNTALDLVAVFGLNGLCIPVALYYLTKDIKDKQAAKNYIYLSVCLLSGMVYYTCMNNYPGIISIYMKTTNDREKIFIRTLIVPVLNYIAFSVVHYGSKHMKMHDPHDSVFLTTVTLLISCFTSRFLQNSLSTYTGTVFLNVLVSVQELVLRLTMKARGKVFEKYIHRKSEAELAAMERENISNSDSEARSYVGRLIIMEMMIEYVSIFMCPIVTALNQKNSIHCHLGYELDGSFNYNLLLFSFVTSLVMEIAVDYICFRLQEKWFRLTKLWIAMTTNGKMWTRLLPIFLVGILLGTHLMLNGFVKRQESFSSDSCAFRTYCLPEPCLCYRPNDTMVVVSPANGNNVSVSLPPLFAALCPLVVGGGPNGTAPWSEDALRAKYYRILSPP